jgi:hypothetical protein
MKTTVTGWTLCSLVLILATTRAATAADPSLVGWWNFEEGPGPTVADASGNNNAGTLNGGVQWLARETGGALELDGSSGYIQIPFSESLRVMNRGDGFTLTAWFRPDAIPSENKEVFQQGDGNGTGRTWLYITSAGQIQTYVGGTATSSGINSTPETWFHGAVVVKEAGASDTIQIYVNGTPAGAATQYGMESAEGAYFIGCHKNLTNFWDGLVDDVRLYNRPLTPEEIRAMVPRQFKAQKPIPPDGDMAVVTPLLQWAAGETGLLHSVYFGTDPNLGPENLVQSRMPMTMYFHVPGMTPGTTYYWRVDEVEGDMTTVHMGDVWTFTAKALTAYLPAPADGANDASPDPNASLNWWAGMNATGHHVFFGDSREAVEAGAPQTDEGTITDTTFTPGPLDPLTTYYWRVDEIGVGGTVTTGPVWSFTTFLSVDDFESYTDDPDEEIFSTWIDGYGTGLNGSMVGYAQAPFTEQKIVHGGKQSMPFDYNNAIAPYYSEAEREWATVQNWTGVGVDTLQLFVRGNAANGLGALYVAVEDSTGKVAVAVHPDASVVRMGTSWTQWNVPLSSLAGVNLGKVKKLYLGVGDRDHPVPDGSGRIYLDDIRLTKP